MYVEPKLFIADTEPLVEMKEVEMVDMNSSHFVHSHKKHQVLSQSLTEVGKIPAVDQSKQLIAGYTNDESKVYPEENLPIIIFGDHTTVLKFVDFPFVVAGDGVKIIEPSNAFHSKYFYYAMCRYNVKPTGYNRHYSALRQIKIPFFSYEYQEKIANFLSLLDERISKQEKKIELLEQLKKGYMQKIFSQELRFRDDNGNEYPEWESTNLGELIEVGKAGGTPSTTVPSYYEGNIPFLSISDMTDQGKYIENTTKFISDSGLNNSAAWVVPSDYLLYAMYASVGKVSISKNKMATSQAIFAARFTEVVTVEYMYYYLTYFQKFLSRYITIGTQGNINAKTLKSFSIIYPHQKEQLKIVQLLSNLDELIAVENKKKCLLGSEKDSYLKQLFI